MRLLYDLIIHLYGDGLQLAALFNPKARRWVKGRKGQFKKIREVFHDKPWAGKSEKSAVSSQYPANGQRPTASGQRVIWFHCASLGEFEQGRPVIEAFREKYPGWKILLTFFSPSGYEVRKNYQGADWIFYLPLDSRWEARKFIDIARPDMVVFVKYEFWFNYLIELYKRNIPVFVISAIFRNDQHFFRWYGSWARKQLKKVTRFFVQDESSKELLKTFGIEQVTVSGDTRFDRVYAIARKAKSNPLIEQFASGKPVFLGGSTWPADEALIAELIRAVGGRMKFIIAPHEVDKGRLAELRKVAVNCLQSGTPSLSPSPEWGRDGVGADQKPAIEFFSALSLSTASTCEVLLIDGIGYLSHLYNYARIAYIGGGFGAGIHNILEAATFGKPVIFGPKYQKFREAEELVAKGGAFPVNNAEELIARVNYFLDQPASSQDAGTICIEYVNEKKGATESILSAMEKFITR